MTSPHSDTSPFSLWAILRYKQEGETRTKTWEVTGRPPSHGQVQVPCPQQYRGWTHSLVHARVCVCACTTKRCWPEGHLQGGCPEATSATHSSPRGRTPIEIHTCSASPCGPWPPASGEATWPSVSTRLLTPGFSATCALGQGQLPPASIPQCSRGWSRATSRGHSAPTRATQRRGPEHSKDASLSPPSSCLVQTWATTTFRPSVASSQRWPEGWRAPGGRRGNPEGEVGCCPRGWGGGGLEGWNAGPVPRVPKCQGCSLAPSQLQGLPRASATQASCTKSAICREKAAVQGLSTRKAPRRVRVAKRARTL